MIGLPSVAAGYAVSSLSTKASQKPYRLAHLTDMHIFSGAVPEQGVSRALIQAQDDGAEVIINGGDAIFDALAKPKEEVEEQWDVFHRTFRKNCSLPVWHVLGNHDVRGWALPDRRPETKLETLEQLSLKRSYYSLERAGWKFIILDSVAYAPERKHGYVASLGEEQFEWLSQELVDNTKPCCLVSHIPFLSAAAFFDGPNESLGNWLVPGEWVHLDARRVKDLFGKHPEVKLCLSGHIHLVDRIEYGGVSYFCNGAVCGKFWKGRYQGVPPSYALLDLYPDGSFERTMVPILNQ